jgi:hypothetical protein
MFSGEVQRTRVEPKTSATQVNLPNKFDRALRYSHVREASFHQFGSLFAELDHRTARLHGVFQLALWPGIALGALIGSPVIGLHRYDRTV